MNIPFWLKGGICKKSPTTNKETPPNGDEFYLIAFNSRFKCLKVSFSIIDISSIIKTFKHWDLSLKLSRVSSFSLLQIRASQWRLPVKFLFHLIEIFPKFTKKGEVV